jgi:hypothetical protein
MSHVEQQLYIMIEDNIYIYTDMVNYLLVHLFCFTSPHQRVPALPIAATSPRAGEVFEVETLRFA